MATSAVSSVEPGGEGGGPRKEAAQGARGGGAKEHRYSLASFQMIWLRGPSPARC